MARKRKLAISIATLVLLFVVLLAASAAAFVGAPSQYVCFPLLLIMLLVVAQGVYTVRAYQGLKRERENELRAEREQIAMRRYRAQWTMQKLRRMNAEFEPADSERNGE